MLCAAIKANVRANSHEEQTKLLDLACEKTLNAAKRAYSSISRRFGSRRSSHNQHNDCINYIPSMSRPEVTEIRMKIVMAVKSAKRFPYKRNGT